MDILKYLFSWAIERISWGLKTEFESATVNETLVFESLNFYYIFFSASCAGECVKWCTSSDYTYFPNYPLSYLWAYGNMSRTFVVENNILCEGYNPSNGKCIFNPFIHVAKTWQVYL